MLKRIIEIIQQNPNLILCEFNWKPSSLKKELINNISFKFEFDFNGDAKYLSIQILDKNDSLILKGENLLNEIKQIEKEWFFIKGNQIYSDERVSIGNRFWEYKSFILNENQLILCTKK